MVILLVLFTLFDLLLLLGALVFWWLLIRAWRAERSAPASVPPSPPLLPARVIALLGRDDVRRLNE